MMFFNLYMYLKLYKCDYLYTCLYILFYFFKIKDVMEVKFNCLVFGMKVVIRVMKVKWFFVQMFLNLDLKLNEIFKRNLDFNSIINIGFFF